MVNAHFRLIHVARGTISTDTGLICRHELRVLERLLMPPLLLSLTETPMMGSRLPVIGIWRTLELHLSSRTTILK